MLQETCEPLGFHGGVCEGMYVSVSKRVCTCVCVCICMQVHVLIALVLFYGERSRLESKELTQEELKLRKESHLDLLTVNYRT